MKKIRLILFFTLMQISGYGQLCEGFETAGSAPTTLADGGTAIWTLGASGNWRILNPKGSLIWGVKATSTLTPSKSGGYSAYIDKENLSTPNISEDWLVTPAINITGMSGAQLKFSSRQVISGDQGSIYKIMISTTDQTTISSFTTLQTWTEPQLGPYDAYTEKVINLSGYTGNIYIAFVKMGAAGGGDRWLLDDVYVGPTCVNPLNLSVTETGLNSVKLLWDNPGGVNQFEVEVKPDSATPTGVGVIVNQNYYTVTGLQP
ncbi:choice-of-anchor J domain-containing protein, partial [Flavobacterium sp. NRK1]|uniref:choice-of-anchor J domain-containing protein n=1 Tax=Flavobacterium sp. NRK1 TaxID=2954929 RepID=UPI00209294CE